jgi:hypothetical protein
MITNSFRVSLPIQIEVGGGGLTRRRLNRLYIARHSSAVSNGRSVRSRSNSRHRLAVCRADCTAALLQIAGCDFSAARRDARGAHRRREGDRSASLSPLTLHALAHSYSFALLKFRLLILLYR